MTVREFRRVFSSLEDPVQVIRARGNVRIIGTYYPEPPLESDEPHTRALSSDTSE